MEISKCCKSGFSLPGEPVVKHRPADPLLSVCAHSNTVGQCYTGGSLSPVAGEAADPQMHQDELAVLSVLSRHL